MKQINLWPFYFTIVISLLVTFSLMTNLGVFAFNEQTHVQRRGLLQSSSTPFDTSVSGTIDPSDYLEYAFNLSMVPPDKIIRVSVHSSSANLDSPILSIIRQKTTVDSFQIPNLLQYISKPSKKSSPTINGCLSRNVSRIVCPMDVSGTIAGYSGLFDVAVTGTYADNFTLIASLEQAVVSIGSTIEFSTTVRNARYFFLDIDTPIYKPIQVIVESPDESLAVVALKRNHCPFIGAEQDTLSYSGNQLTIGSSQLVQTMTQRAALTLSDSTAGTGRWFIGILVLPNADNSDSSDSDSTCSSTSSDSKSFTLRVVTYMPPLDYATPIVVMFGMFFSICFAACVILYLGGERIAKQSELYFVVPATDKKKQASVISLSLLLAPKLSMGESVSTNESVSSSSNNNNNNNYSSSEIDITSNQVSISVTPPTSNETNQTQAQGNEEEISNFTGSVSNVSDKSLSNSSLNTQVRLRSSSTRTDYSYSSTSGGLYTARSISSLSQSHVEDKEIDEEGYDSLSDVLNQASNDKAFIRSKSNLMVADLNKKTSSARKKRLSRYGVNLVIIGVFYFLPVLQLVLSYQKQFTAGNEDLCFYNFLCERPLGIFTHFNNMISNLGYILLGLLFIAVVRIRHLRYTSQRKIADNANIELEECGLPRMYGLFYSIGIALALEGIFSSSYHVCPTSENFQFDTAFMYVIAMLMILCLFQKRHPDLHSNPDSAYAFLAAIIFINVIGVYYGNTGFWVTTFLLFILFSVLVSVHVYYFGVWSFDKGLPLRLFATLVLFFRYVCCSFSTNSRNKSLSRQGALRRNYQRVYDDDEDSSIIINNTTTPNNNNNNNNDNMTEAQEDDDDDELKGTSTFGGYSSFNDGNGSNRSGDSSSDNLKENATVLKLYPYRSNVRWLYFIFANAINFSAFLYGVVVKPNFSTFLLAILILNLIMYFTMYIILKRVAGETMDTPTYLYIVASIVCWIPALYYFLQNVTNWTLSPPESRAHNENCIFLDFFDTHDVWHFLSAGGLFFSALVMLSLDDNLNSKPRSSIPVF